MVLALNLWLSTAWLPPIHNFSARLVSGVCYGGFKTHIGRKAYMEVFLTSFLTSTSKAWISSTDHPRTPITFRLSASSPISVFSWKYIAISLKYFPLAH